MASVKDIKKMEGAEMMATFLGAWVKYGFMMLYVIFSSVAHIINRFKGKNDEE